jgi:copper chaperone
MQRITLKVSGMSCMGCVNSVKNLLGAVAGVGLVEVDLAQGRVEVGYDPAQATPQDLRAAIEMGGYQVVG